MTISTQQASQTFLGNGVTNTFDFSFVGDASIYIIVQYTDITGTTITLSPSQYSVFLNPRETGQIWGIGGTVTYPTVGSPIATGTFLTVTRVLPLTQVTSISGQGAFSPQAIETALDTLEMQLQQVSGRTGLFRGVWSTNVLYNFGDYVVDGTNGTNTGNYYMCVLVNTSGTWSTDLANGDWILVINVQSITADTAAAAASATAAANSASSASTSATNAATSATSASTSATNAATSATSAATSAAQASNYATSYSGTSASSVTIGLGSKSFTTQSSKLWINGQFLQIASNANAINYMHGTVTSYSGTTLTMNITDIGGSGTFSDWNISISGTQGPMGSTSSFSAITSGTNIIANMIVGSGATISVTGSGTIAATSVPASGIASGTNTTAAVVIGSGASLSASGSGTITATSTPASGISGTLGITQGGTGLNTLTANNVILGNGTSNPSFVAPGTAGNHLVSDGATWTSNAIIGLAKAYVLWNGTGTVAIRGTPFNVSSITDVGVGKYVVNFSSSLSSANYSPAAWCGEALGGGGNAAYISRFNDDANQTASACPVTIFNSNGTECDVAYLSMVFFGG